MARRKMTEAEKKAFVKRMAAARKKAGKKKTLRVSKKRAPIKKVPVYRIIIKKGTKKVGYWTGKSVEAKNSFDTLKSASAKFASPDSAMVYAHRIKGVPSGYKLYIEKNMERAVKK